MNLSTKRAREYTDLTREYQKKYIILWRRQSAENKETIKDLATRFECSMSNVKQMVRELKDQKLIK